MHELKGRGTAACYRRGCDHKECHRVYVVQVKSYAYAHSQGKRRLVPAAVALERAREQMTIHDLGPKAFCKAARMSTAAFWGMKTGRFKSIHIDTYRRMAELPDLQQPRLVPALATRLRIQALQAEGWGVTALAGQGVRTGNLYYGQKTVTLAISEQIVQLVQTLSVGPSERAGLIARNKGWQPRRAYDLELLADPLWNGLDGLLDRDSSSAEDLTEYQFLRSQGVDAERALARIGRNKDWLRKVMRRVPKPDDHHLG